MKERPVDFERPTIAHRQALDLFPLHVGQHPILSRRRPPPALQLLFTAAGKDNYGNINALYPVLQPVLEKEKGMRSEHSDSD
jgi:hypothetical protein